MWFDGVHGDAWGPSRHFEHILAYLLNDMSSDNVTINTDLLGNMTNHLRRRGSLGKLLHKLLHWRQHYNSPLKPDDNQLRHSSCRTIVPRDQHNSDMVGISTEELELVTLLKQYNRLSGLTDLYYYSTIKFAQKIVLCKCNYREWPSQWHPYWPSCRVSQ